MLCNCDARKMIIEHEKNKFIKLKCERCNEESMVYIKEDKPRAVRGSFVANSIESLKSFCEMNKIDEKDNPEFVVIWDEYFEEE